MAVTPLTTVETVREKFPQAVVETTDFRDEQTIVLKPESLVAVCAYLQKRLQYNILSTITAFRSEIPAGGRRDDRFSRRADHRPQTRIAGGRLRLSAKAAAI